MAASASAEAVIPIAICGALGRMGRSLLLLSADDVELRVTCALTSSRSLSLGAPVREIVAGCPWDCPLESEIGESARGARVMIDFSTPGTTVKLAPECAKRGIALVVGTTGLTSEERAAVEAAAAHVPVLIAHNFSLGVNLLVRIAGDVARALGPAFDVEIVEAHHNRKLDSPSGTALGIARSIADALGKDLATALRCGREGRTAKREAGEIGMHSVRLGNVIGEHTAHFASDFERIELTHKAQSREVFAAGALRAAKWIAGRAPGVYTMEDVLFGGSRRDE